MPHLDHNKISSLGAPTHLERQHLDGWAAQQIGRGQPRRLRPQPPAAQLSQMHRQGRPVRMRCMCAMGTVSSTNQPNPNARAQHSSPEHFPQALWVHRYGPRQPRAWHEEGHQPPAAAAAIITTER